MLTINKLLKNLPLARKLTIFTVLTSTLCLLLAMSIIVTNDQLKFKKSFKDELAVLASVISNRSSAAVVFDDEDLALNNLKSLTFREDIISGCIYRIEANTADTLNTTILARYPKSSSVCPTYSPPDKRFIENLVDRNIQVVQPIMLNKEIVGYLHLQASTQSLEKRLFNNILTFLSVILVACLFAYWLSTLIARIITEPLRVLGSTTSWVAERDDYSIRAEVSSDDELGQVIHSFNHMLDVIEREDASLRESEEKFRLISSASKVGIFQLDTHGHFVYANAELSKITGLSQAALLQGQLLGSVHPEDRQTVQAQWEAMLRDGEPVNLNCRLKENDTRWINGHIGLLKKADDQLIGFLGTISDITDVKNAQVQLEQMAFYDTLTGLANRRLFRNRLEHVVANISREGHSLALLMLDLDNFKNINDSLGHDAGDSLLTIIAERLQLCVRSSDTVARLGGDEFAIILPGVINSLAISHVAEKLLRALETPIILNEIEIRISASIGISMAPDDCNSAEELIKNADLALYRAKDTGRNNYQFYTSEMNRALFDHLSMIEDLRLAYENREFSLVYQPQINLETGELIGFESLLRWQSPKRGFVSPVDFIPVAEETGLIIELGRWVIKTACKQLRQILDQGLVSDDAAVTVNISVKQFQDNELVEYIKSQLDFYNLSAKHFEIELTESVLMENLDVALDKLHAIRDLGVLISIDDFGTGYSSLGYLKQLPVDILKVDRSFVKDIPHDKDDMELTAAVIAMAHKLRYKVVAEGVETPEQVAFLQASECDYGQGYFFAKPLTFNDLVDFCQQRKNANSITN